MRIALLLLLAGFAAGCLTPGTYVAVKQYAIDAEVTMDTRDATGWEVAVRDLAYAEPYKRKMVYRADPFSVSYRDAEEWAELPRDTATRLLRDALASTGFFADVGDASNVSTPTLVLTGELRRFDELRYAERRAICEIRIELRSVADRNAVWAQTYAREVPMSNSDATTFAEAMSAALAEIVAEATSDIVDAVAQDIANNE